MSFRFPVPVWPVMPVRRQAENMILAFVRPPLNPVPRRMPPKEHPDKRRLEGATFPFVINGQVFLGERVGWTTYKGKFGAVVISPARQKTHWVWDHKLNGPRCNARLRSQWR